MSGCGIQLDTQRPRSPSWVAAPLAWRWRHTWRSAGTSHWSGWWSPGRSLVRTCPQAHADGLARPGRGRGRAPNSLLHCRRARRDPLPQTRRQLRGPRHRHPGPNDLILVDELGFAPLDDTGAQLLFRSSRPPTNADPSASDRTGRSSPGVDFCPNTPPRSACLTGSCTTATPWSLTATATG